MKHCPSKVSLPLARVLERTRPWREAETESSMLDPASAFFWIQKYFIITDFPKVIDRSKQNCYFLNFIIWLTVFGVS